MNVIEMEILLTYRCSKSGISKCNSSS